jgi:hypothetical protein
VETRDSFRSILDDAGAILYNGGTWSIQTSTKSIANILPMIVLVSTFIAHIKRISFCCNKRPGNLDRVITTRQLLLLECVVHLILVRATWNNIVRTKKDTRPRNEPYCHPLTSWKNIDETTPKSSPTVDANGTYATTPSSIHCFSRSVA